jgi:type I restriction enzyme M protein
MIDSDLVDCIVALPPQLFYSTPIPVCLWFVARNRSGRPFRDRRGEVLFIDARQLSALVDRTHRELTNDEISRISRTYHAWRGEDGVEVYSDVAGFCQSTLLGQIRAQDYVLTPGRYVGRESADDSDGSLDDKVRDLSAQLLEQMAASHEAETAVQAALGRLELNV